MSTASQGTAIGNLQPNTQRMGLRIWTVIKKMNYRLKIGFVFAIFVVFAAYILPLFSGINAGAWNTFTGEMPPSAQHIWGTTNMGQDTFWLTWVSLRNSLNLGLYVAVCTNVIGIGIGLLVGFKGGWIDSVVMTLSNTLMSTPSLPILIVLAALLRGHLGLAGLGLIMIVFGWPWPCTFSRSMVLSLREREFINTAWFSGQSTFKIIVLEILPHIILWAMWSLLNGVLAAIGGETGLALLGLSSMQNATIGTEIYWAGFHDAMMLGDWYWFATPIVLMVVICFVLAMLSTGFNEASRTRRS